MKKCHNVTKSQIQWAWHIFQQNFEYSIQMLDVLMANSIVLNRAAKLFPLKLRIFVPRRTLLFRILEGLDHGISPNRAHQRATTQSQRLPSLYDGKLVRFSLEL